MKQMKFLPRMAGLAVAGSLLALAGCSSREPTADAGRSSHAAAIADAPPVDACVLMPVANVAAILQANDGGSAKTQYASIGGMCSYRDSDTDTKLLIDFTRLKSVEAAEAAMANERKMFHERGIEPTPVTGLGDEAFAAEAEGSEGLKIRVGAYEGQINLSVGERPPVSLRPAVLALGKQVLARLP